jgi:phage gpG-like protein
MAEVEWHGDAAMDYVRRRAVQALTRCAIEVTRRAKELLSVAGTNQAGGKGGKGKRAYGASRSAPGEPPRKQTGRLRASVAYEVDGLEARVGTNVTYGKHLELGTRRGLAPRPWLRRALYETAGRIGQILSGPGGGG